MQVSDEDRKRRQGKIILVVDDDPQVSDFIKLVLEHAGFTVMVVHKGEDALATLARITPVAILMDVNLDPNDREWDGYETCARMRNNYRDLKAPVIFVTVRKTQEDVKRALQVGGDYFVTKPLAADKLLERIVHALGRGRSERRPTVR
jgi:DNA-binding response OmpR family regulator